MVRDGIGLDRDYYLKESYRHQNSGLRVFDVFQKSTVTMLSVGRVGRGSGTALADVNSVNLSTWKGMAVTFQASYSANIGSGCDVELYTSYNDSTWDTRPYTIFSPYHSDSSQQIETALIDSTPYYMKARVKNYGTGVQTSKVRVIATLWR